MRFIKAKFDKSKSKSRISKHRNIRCRSVFRAASTHKAKLRQDAGAKRQSDVVLRRKREGSAQIFRQISKKTLPKVRAKKRKFKLRRV